jgi:hypothetical protein
MNNTFLDTAEKLLTNDPEVIVPIKRLWKQSLDASIDRNLPTLNEFTDALAHDDRFEFISAEWASVAADTDVSEQPARERETMENVGIYAESHVKLRRIQITPTLLAGIMSKKIDTTIEALMHAWDIRPQGDSETEDQLLQILVQAKKLQHDLRALLAEKSSREQEI